jgi:hypothetical protein
MLVGTAIIEEEPDIGCFGVGTAQRAGLEGAAQRKQIAGRLGEVRIDRIELLDSSQIVGGAAADQRTLGDQSPADTAADRRLDLGIL